MPRSIDYLDTGNTVITADPTGISITDRERIFFMVNPAYCKLYGYSEAELVSKHFTMVIAEEY